MHFLNKSLPMPNVEFFLKISCCKRNHSSISKRSHGGRELCASLYTLVSRLLDLFNLETERPV